MDQEYFNKKVEELNPWYNNLYDDDGKLLIKGSPGRGDPVWKDVEKMINFSTEDMRVLDVGGNAGLHCFRLMKDTNLKEAIIAEPAEMYEKQFYFLKEYFKDKYKKKLPISFIKCFAEKLDEENIEGQFEIVFAVAMLYHVGKRTARGPEAVKAMYERAVKNICEKSSYIVIVKDKVEDRISKHDMEFHKNGFFIDERMKINRNSIYTRYKRRVWE